MKTTDDPIYVAIIEDDDDIRESIALIINGTPGFSCIAAYTACEPALADIEKNLPDVILMDIELPGMSGVAGVREIKRRYADIDVLMLTIHEDDETVFDSLCAGACGYLTKNTPPVRLPQAIEEIYRGGAPMSTNIARMVTGSFARRSQHLLSDREQEVLTLLCRGKSYKMIADTLCISADTVRSHIKKIYRKLEVNSNSEAVAKALQEKIVRP